jgi:hypothetical protein
MLNIILSSFAIRVRSRPLCPAAVKLVWSGQKKIERAFKKP